MGPRAERGREPAEECLNDELKDGVAHTEPDNVGVVPVGLRAPGRDASGSKAETLCMLDQSSE